MPIEELSNYLGEQCTVVISETPYRTVSGVLESVGKDGTFTIRTLQGSMYGWPALRVEDETHITDRTEDIEAM